MKTEPVILGLTPALITSLVTAGVNLANSFGWTQITPDQLNALNTFASILMAVLATLGMAFARSRVTPVQ